MQKDKQAQAGIPFKVHADRCGKVDISVNVSYRSKGKLNQCLKANVNAREQEDGEGPGRRIGRQGHCEGTGRRTGRQEHCEGAGRRTGRQEYL